MADYPPVSFYFKVDFNLGDERDLRFQEVSGLSAEITLESLNEGGENRFVHRLPAGSKYPNLVLKRGLVTQSKLLTWVHEAIDNMSFTPTDVLVSLMLTDKEPLITWQVFKAYPVKWSVSGFKSTDNTVAIESMELAYQYFLKIGAQGAR